MQENLEFLNHELILIFWIRENQKAVSDLAQLMNTFDSGACAMYAFEKEIPKISQTKLDGLSEFYQIDK